MRANTEDLGVFVDGGVSHVNTLQTSYDKVVKAQTIAIDALGGAQATNAVPLFGELIQLTTTNNGFVRVIRDTLNAFDVIDGPLAAAAEVTVDWAISEWAEGTGSISDVIDAGETFQDAIDRIDKGDDLGMSNSELNAVHDLLEPLDSDELTGVFANFSDQQLERIFHNVHSSSWRSNDWDDRERTEFYEILHGLSVEEKTRAGTYSPYLEAYAHGEQAIAGNGSATAAFNSLTAADDFRQDLNFNQRAALLWQAGNYPNEDSIANLERLTTKDWFQDFGVRDTQRTAKMIAFLSQHSSGDQAIIDNTLDQFLSPDAPYTFDWERTGTAYGSAGGTEFHFNRRYLPAGNDPVDTSNSNTIHMVTHTVAHEVNHLVNDDGVAESYEYFMGEYRAYYVGHMARYGTPPTRDDVEARVRLLLTADKGAYQRIAAAVDDSEEGPKIADFVADIVGRPVTAENVAAEISAGVTDGGDPAPAPVSVDGGPNNLDNS